MDKQGNLTNFVSGDGRFGMTLPLEVVQDMWRICKDSNGLETGGILIGRYNEEHNRAIVCTATGPPPDSQHFFARFLRGISGLQRLLNGLWNDKERTFYLGEWHHHPLAIPTPSPHDIAQMRQIARDHRYACPEPILVIVSISTTADWHLTAHVFTQTDAVIALHPLVSDTAAISPTTSIN